MNMPYEGISRKDPNRKTLRSIANEITAESTGVNQGNFKRRYVQDKEHGRSFFREVCKHIGGLKNHEINEMLNVLMREADHISGDVYIFDEDRMYEVLISNPTCKKVCEKQGYNNWKDIIQRFS